MIFRQLFDSDSSTYTYLIADEHAGEAALVDPVLERIDRDLALISELGLRLVLVLETHVHADHITAAGLLRERTGARTVSGARGAGCADLHVKGGDVVPLGGLGIQVLDTPGHTDDSVSYLIDGRVLTGDALTIRGAGRTDFQNGDPRTLYRTITRTLFTLPDDTLVYPGHDYRGLTVSTIGEEKRHNPRIAGKTEEQFVAIMDALNLPRPRRIDEAVPANRACGMA
jgi:sulfur dioxygenase